MAFEFINSEDQSIPARVTHIPGISAEVYTKGEALMTDATGAWTKLTNGNAVGGFANQTKTCSASDLTLEVIEARPGDTWRAPYTGTPDAGFVIGCQVADISSDGLSVLSSDVTGGAFAVFDINTSKVTCRVKPRKRIWS